MGSSANSIDILPVLIPLKYRVTKKNTALLLRDLQKVGAPPKYLNEADVNMLLGKIDLGSLTDSDLCNIHSEVNLQLLSSTCQRKLSGSVTIRQTPESFIRRSWLDLFESIKKPVWSFQELYFDHMLGNELREDLGSELARIVEEVLRDEQVTDNEANFLWEKAQELDVSHDKLEPYLSSVFKGNMAIRRLVFDICKDGIVTDSEKRYLVEKAKSYGVSRASVIDEVHDVSRISSAIHTSLADPLFYEAIIVLLFKRHLTYSGDLSVEASLAQLDRLIQSGDDLGQLSDIIKQMRHELVEGLNHKLGVNYFDVSISVSEICSACGLDYVKHSNIVAECETCGRSQYSEQQTADMLKDIEEVPGVEIDDHVLQFGERSYKISYVENSGGPLFSYCENGAETLVYLNREHCFHQENPKHRLLVLTLVVNLQKNYESEDLCNDIQYLLNPPSGIRRLYQKE